MKNLLDSEKKAEAERKKKITETSNEEEKDKLVKEND